MLTNKLLLCSLLFPVNKCLGRIKFIKDWFNIEVSTNPWLFSLLYILSLLDLVKKVEEKMRNLILDEYLNDALELLNSGKLLLQTVFLASYVWLYQHQGPFLICTFFVGINKRRWFILLINHYQNHLCFGSLRRLKILVIVLAHAVACSYERSWGSSQWWHPLRSRGYEQKFLV